MPEAVSSGSSLNLMRGERDTRERMEVVERVEQLQGLNLHSIVAQLVGAVQAQSQQIDAVSRQVLLVHSMIADANENTLT